MAPYDIVFSEINVLQPDLIYISNKHLDIITPTNVSGAPDLTVEVLSPTRIDYDRRRKKAVYEKFGVREYWVIDPVNKSLEVWSNGGRGFVHQGTYSSGRVKPSLLLTGFELDLAELFEE